MGLAFSIASHAFSRGAEFDTPQANGLAADRDSTFGHKIFDITSTQIRSVIKPDNVLDDFRRKPVTLVDR